MKKRSLVICLLLAFALNTLAGFCYMENTSTQTIESPADKVQEIYNSITTEDTVTEAEEAEESSNSQFLVKINYGIDSLVSYSGSTPVQITITNQGNDFAGEVTLTVVREYVKSFGYSNDISIPAGTTKRIFMTIPANASYSNCVVRILDERGNTVYERTIMNNLSMSDRTVIGVLSDDFAALNYLDGVSVVFSKYNTGYVFSTGQLTEETMPDIASALSTCKIIVIDNYDTSKLSDAQYQALRQWVENGGILLLGTGAEYNKVLSKFKDDFVSGSIGSLSKQSVQMTGLLDVGFAGEYDADTDENYTTGVEDEASVTVPDLDTEEAQDTEEEAGTEEYDQNKTEEVGYTGETLNMDVLDISVDGGSAVEGIADGAIFIEKQMGIGKVVVSKTALGMEPFSSYKENINVISGLLNAVVTQDIVRTFNGQSGDVAFNLMNSTIVDDANEAQIPDSGKYTILFLIYIVLVGPGIYILLKWKDKNKVIWLAIPAIALLFTAGVYAVSINDTIRDPLLTSFTIERYEENAKTVLTGFSVMNPKSAAYEINLDGRYSNVKPMDNEHYSYSSIVFRNETVCMMKETVDHTVLKLSKSQAFSPVYLETTATEPVEQNIDVDIQAYKDGFAGTVTNHLDHDLVNVIVTMAHYASYIDRIPAGESVEVKKDSSQKGIYASYQFTDVFLPSNAYSTERKKYNMMGSMGAVLADDYYELGSGEGFVAGYVEGETRKLSSDADVVEKGWVLAYKAFETTYADVVGKYEGNIHMVYRDSFTYDWDMQYGYSWDSPEIEAEYDFGGDGINTLYYYGGIDTYHTQMLCYIWNPETMVWEQIFNNNETEFRLEGYYLDEDKSRIRLKFQSSTNTTGDSVPVIGGGEN